MGARPSGSKEKGSMGKKGNWEPSQEINPQGKKTADRESVRLKKALSI